MHGKQANNIRRSILKHSYLTKSRIQKRKFQVARIHTHCVIATGIKTTAVEAWMPWFNSDLQRRAPKAVDDAEEAVIQRGGTPPCMVINCPSNEDENGITRWHTPILMEVWKKWETTGMGCKRHTSCVCGLSMAKISADGCQICS